MNFTNRSIQKSIQAHNPNNIDFEAKFSRRSKHEYRLMALIFHAPHGTCFYRCTRTVVDHDSPLGQWRGGAARTSFVWISYNNNLEINPQKRNNGLQ